MTHFESRKMWRACRPMASVAVLLALLVLPTLAEEEAEPIWRETEMKEVAVSPDGKLAISAGSGLELFLWEVDTGKLRAVWHSRHRFAYSLAFSPDGKRVASGDWWGGLCLFDVVTGQEALVFAGHPGDEFGNYPLKCLAFSPDGRQLASGGDDCTLRLWDVESGKQTRAWQMPVGVRALAFSPDGTRIVAGGDSGMTALFDVASPEERPCLVLGGVKEAVYTTGFTRDGKIAVAVLLDGTAVAWSTNVEEAEEKVAEMPLAKPKHTLDLELVTTDMDAVGDTGLFAVSGWDSCAFWDPVRNERVSSIELEGGGDLKSIAMTPDGAFLITSQERRLAVTDRKTGKRVRTAYDAKRGYAPDEFMGLCPALRNWADETWEAEKYEAMAKAMTERLAEEPRLDTFDHAAVLFYLGLAQHALGKKEEATASFEASRAMDALFRPDRRQFPGEALDAYDATAPAED